MNSNHTTYRFLRSVLGLTFAMQLSLPSYAQSAPDNPDEPRLKPSLELTTEFAQLTNGFGHANTQAVKLTYGTPIGVVDITATRQARFGEQGNYLGLQLTQDLNAVSYFSVAFGGGGSVLWPIYRTDVNYYRKFGTEKNYVAGLGFMYAANRENRDDRGLLLSLTAYYPDWVIEGGVHYNRNNPGWVQSNSVYTAITWGRDQWQTVTVRAERAREAYQLLGNNEELVDFRSHNGSLEWRYWLNKRTTLIAGAKVYRNPFYRQTTGTLGVKFELP